MTRTDHFQSHIPLQTKECGCKQKSETQSAAKAGMEEQSLPFRTTDWITKPSSRPKAGMKKGAIRASFTVEAALLMTIILPILLALLYYGFYLHDRGVLNGASQETAAHADLNNWKKSGNNRLSKYAKQLEKRTGPSRNVSSSVQVSREKVSVTYKGSMSLPGLLPSLFGKNQLSTGASAQRALLYPADLIRKIRGLEYVSALLKNSS